MTTNQPDLRPIVIWTDFDKPFPICDYGHDVGSMPTIDYRLWLAAIALPRLVFAENPRGLRFSPADWSRDT